MIPTAHKTYPTAPIGRCTCCGTPAYDMDDLNFRCEQCGDGVVASVAMQDWHRCGACLGTGRSLIWTKRNDDKCPVCCGSGHVTYADFDTEIDEAELVEEVLRARMTGKDHWPPRASDVKMSARGSIGILRDHSMSRAAAKAWHKRVKASADAMLQRITDLEHDFEFWDAVEAASRLGATKSAAKSNARASTAHCGRDDPRQSPPGSSTDKQSREVR